MKIFDNTCREECCIHNQDLQNYCYLIDVKHQWHQHGALFGYGHEPQYCAGDDYYRGHDVRLNEYAPQTRHSTALQGKPLVVQRAMNDLNETEACNRY